MWFTAAILFRCEMTGNMPGDLVSEESIVLVSADTDEEAMRLQREPGKVVSTATMSKGARAYDADSIAWSACIRSSLKTCNRELSCSPVISARPKSKAC